MYKNKSKLFSIFIVTLFISSLIYFEPSLNDEKLTDTVFPNKPILPDIDNESDENINDQDDNDNTPVKKVEIPGDYETFAFFSGGTGYIYGTSSIGDSLIFDPADEDPLHRRNVVEWVPYDDIKDDGTLAKELYWRALSTVPLCWPNDTNWFYLREQGYPNEPSKMYSPAFTEEFEISGRVHFLSYLELNNGATFSETINIGYRLSLYLFNPADPNNPTLITSTTIVESSSSMTVGQRTFSADIASPVTIPVGYRLRMDIEVRFSTVPATGSFLQYTGWNWGGGGTNTWTITDGVYSNTYTINNITRMAGLQLYLRSKTYPNIQIFNAVNETVYSAARDITIDVTDGSTSSFRWNGDSVWTPIYDSILTPLLTEHGWNTLEVKASDPIYNNTVVELYQFGYDESPVNVVLDNAINTSIIPRNYDLQFSVYNITSATFEWDNDGSPKSFTSPYNITAANYEGLHNLTIITIDFYTTESYYYEFTFESIPPTIQLISPANNNTLQSPGKNIDIQINDSSGVDIVTYYWDGDIEEAMTSLGGNLYRTNLPAAGGWHHLYVTANDTYGNQISSHYTFFTDPTILNVELTNMIDGSYYVGGNDVNVTITSSNDTIKYQWDNGIWKDKSEAEWDGDLLKLKGAEGLPSTLGVHILKIRTGDLTNDEHTFTFTFTIDQQAPEFDTSVLNYSNLRYLGSETLTFTVTDNFTLSTEIILSISVDGGLEQSLLFPFLLPLFSFFDGNHSIVIYIEDIAGNVNVTTIYVIVDK
jgi:hypothetical protein